MFHPIFSVLVRRPELVMAHLAGYAGLMREEASKVGAQVVGCAVAAAVAVVGALVFLVLAGVALMLGAMQQQFHWALIAVPAVPLALAVIAALTALRKVPQRAFSELRSQLDTDAQTLRTLGARS